jgi:hypothetical protein
MATKSYWYVREHLRSGLFHLVEGNAGSLWREEPTVQAICGKRIASEDGKWSAQYEGDMIGWVMCASCTDRVDPTRHR